MPLSEALTENTLLDLLPASPASPLVLLRWLSFVLQGNKL